MYLLPLVDVGEKGCKMLSRKSCQREYSTNVHFNSYVWTHKDNGRGYGKMRLSLSSVGTEQNRTGILGALMFWHF